MFAHLNVWSKVPKNPTQVKEKIVERLLALCQRGPDGKFVLEQRSIVLFLKQIWGKDSINLAPHPNDRVRLYGIIMSMPKFRFALQRLCNGVTSGDDARPRHTEALQWCCPSHQLPDS